MEVDAAEDQHESSDVQGAVACSSAGGDAWKAWGSWGMGILDTVKEKSAVTLQMVRKDLNEFVDVIQGDTTVAINDTAAKLSDEALQDSNDEGDRSALSDVSKTMKKGLSTLLNTVSDYVTVEPDDTSEERIVILSEDKSVRYDRKQVKIQAMQCDPETYSAKPNDLDGCFTSWSSDFDLESKRSEMSNLLAQESSIRAIYTKLVPNQISHSTFWQRYFYSIHIIEKEEHLREELLARASLEESKEDACGWDDDEDVVGDGGEDFEVLIPAMKTDSDPTGYEPVNLEPADLHQDGACNLIRANSDGSSNESSNWGDLVEPDQNEAESVQRSSATEVDQCYRTNDVQDNEGVDINRLTPVARDQNITPTNEVIKNTGDNSDGTNKSQTDDDHELNDDCSTEEILPVDLQIPSTSGDIGATEQVDVISTEQVEAEVDSEGSSNQQSTPDSGESWISIDDSFKVKKTKNEKEIDETDDLQQELNASSSSAIFVESSDVPTDIDPDADDDFDINDLDIDVTDEDLAELINQVKDKNDGKLDDDDDWENW